MGTDSQRRVVYIPEPQWDALRTQAFERRTTISAVIRQMIAGSMTGRREPPVQPPATRPTAVAPAGRPERPQRNAPTAARSAQAQRDEILKRVNRATSV